ncbi:MAG: DUF3071 domain-containing protein [Bifidobacteriaceae bacterium]|jgi:hypothetical protein|nr:DUF3071 domain-containing protein [Bifidobacteriaceae bacterium]
MNELTFSRGEDGRLIGVDEAGEEYALAISEELRAAVREAPLPDLPEITISIPERLRPKDIQALVRSGADPEELAQVSGIAIEQVSRYAAPVLDERLFVTERARGLRMSHDPEALTLDRLAQERLAERGVDGGSLRWDAVRQGNGWVVRLDFDSAEGPARARWRVDLTASTLTPIDDAARWISRSIPADTPVPPVRLLSAVPVPTGDASLTGPEDSTLSLLDDLMDARGLRDPVSPVEPPDRPAGPGDVLELHRGERLFGPGRGSGAGADLGEDGTTRGGQLDGQPSDGFGRYHLPGDRSQQRTGPVGPEPPVDVGPFDTIGTPTGRTRRASRQPSRADLPTADTLAPDVPAGGPQSPPSYRPVRSTEPGHGSDTGRPLHDVVWQDPGYSQGAGDDQPDDSFDRQPPATERPSIWTRPVPHSFDTPGQGSLFQAAPVERPGQGGFGQGGPDPEPDPDPEPPVPPTRSRSATRRASVPSWDEIVFGASRTDT